MGATTVGDIVELYRGSGHSIIDWRSGEPIPSGQVLQYLDERITGMTDGNGLPTDRKPLAIGDFGSGHSTHYSLAEQSTRVAPDVAPDEWVSRLLVYGPPLQYSL